jgi:uncharacterized membrane protein (DUF106 family)
MFTVEILVGVIVALVAGAVGMFVKQTNDVARLKERMFQLEKTVSKNDEHVSEMLSEMTKSIQRIERALVKAGFIPVE